MSLQIKNPKKIKNCSTLKTQSSPPTTDTETQQEKKDAEVIQLLQIGLVAVNTKKGTSETAKQVKVHMNASSNST
jgi:hypothetical protein